MLPLIILAPPTPAYTRGVLALRGLGAAAAALAGLSVAGVLEERVPRAAASGVTSAAGDASTSLFTLALGVCGQVGARGRRGQAWHGGHGRVAARARWAPRGAGVRG
jgi:hypothetical protein